MKQQVSLQLIAETDIEATSCRTGRARIRVKTYQSILLFKDVIEKWHAREGRRCSNILFVLFLSALWTFTPATEMSLRSRFTTL